MLVKFASLLLLLVHSFEAFRAPENIQRPTSLPKISNQKSTTQKSDQPNRHATTRKRWGIDKTNENDYWHDSRIHTLGNVGFWGAVHAALAPVSTKMIDVLAYNGTDIRQLVAEELSIKVKSSKARVIDLCCGVGISTRALGHAFPNAETVIGVDTSSEMISMAQFLTSHLSIVQPFLQTSSKRAQAMACASGTTFSCGNAEKTSFPKESFDLVTIMYAFHEAPKNGRERILREAHRLLEPGGTLAVIDISTEYTPSSSMLAGEPYVLEYQKNIHRQLRTFRGFANVRYKTLVPEHVGMWILERSLF